MPYLNPHHTVLVTGNQGYIGSVLTHFLKKAGYQVIGLDNGAFKDVSFIPRELPHQQRYQDVRDISQNDLAGINAIIHLAALSNDPLGELNPDLTQEINHRASVRLAKTAKAAGVKRFIFSSSCSIYGQSDAKLVDETAPQDPKTAYAESKVATEQELLPLASKKFTPISMRNATVFGISPRLRLDLVVQNLAATGFTTGTIEILSDGTPWRPLLHVNDLASAVIHLLNTPQERVAGQAFNIGHQNNNCQIKDVATTVSQVIPDTTVRINTDSSPDERSYQVDFAKIYALGWRPTWTVRDGIEQIHQAFQQQQLTANNFSNPAYHTLKHYQQLIAAGQLTPELRIPQELPVA